MLLIRVVVSIVLLTVFAYPCSMSFFKQPYHKNRRSDTALFRFEKDGKAGFIDTLGTVVIPPKFDVGWFAEEDFVEGLSPARQGENWGFIDPHGQWVIAPQYWRVEHFSEGLASVTLPVQTNFAGAYIDKGGKTVIEFPKGVAEANPFSEGLAAVRLHGSVSSGKLGYIDRSGNAVVPFELAHGGPFREGLAAVVFDGECYVEEREGSPRSTPPSVPAATSCGGVPDSVAKTCGEGFINKRGEVVYRFEGVRDFSEGLAAVQNNGKWGFIDPQGQFRIALQYEAARSFSGGFAAVKSDGKWGYIDRTGEWIVRPEYSSADDFSEGRALTNTGYIDTTGKRISDLRGGSAFVQGLAHVALGSDEFGYLNRAGKVVFRYRPAAVEASMLPYSEP